MDADDDALSGHRCSRGGMMNPQKPGGVTGRNLTATELIAQFSPSTVLDAVPERLRDAQPQSLFPQTISYRNVTYAIIPGYRPLLLDLHIPAGGPGPHPLVIFAHAGGFAVGVKEWGPWPFLLQAGYAVASVSYRLRDEAVYPAPVHDIKAAVRWCRANGSDYRLRSDRIVG